MEEAIEVRETLALVTYENIVITPHETLIVLQLLEFWTLFGKAFSLDIVVDVDWCEKKKYECLV